MNSVKYVKPAVSLFDCTNQDVNIDLWLKSKDTVVKAGTDIVVIGEEVIPMTDYKDKILKMNMQYNNFPYCIFEIQGSILFRDILYNINHLAQWATSLRLIHSVIDQSDASNFEVSSEYEGNKDWENAFKEYFELLQDDNRVDVSRVKMPYSMSSKYWVGINFKTLISLLSMLKLKLPFFFNIYGKLFIEEYYDNFNIDLNEYLTSNLDSSISKYFRSTSEFEESITKIGDYYYINQTMGMILYSQFIRQAGVEVCGLYNLLENNEYAVIKGDTLVNVTYIAHKDRVRKTISNRLCWFSQSDGDESNPCYWSKFINSIIKDMTRSEIMDLLPCRFKDYKLKSCHFDEDLKFRDQNLQKGYIPCAIRHLDLNYANQRIQLCNNKLNNLYREITYYCKSKGLLHTWVTQRFTSKLSIQSDKFITSLIENKIKEELYIIEKAWSTKNWELLDQLTSDYYSYGIGNDLTCMLKGYAIDRISKILLDEGFNHYLINFGGDIYGYNTEALFNIQDSKFNIKLKGVFSVFTSGNNNLRGDHIQGGLRGTTTVFGEWCTKHDNSNTTLDALATKLHANEFDKVDSLLLNVSDFSFNYLCLDEEGNCLNTAYCASPFFNPEQVSIRDNMIKSFNDIFRPDLTESSKKYDEGSHNSNLVEDVVDDNISGINSSECLVFPVSTSDLGTLFEVGVALAEKKTIIKYHEKGDMYIISPLEVSIPIKDEKTLFDCSNKLAVISLGYASCFMKPENIYYELKGCPDNIMLSVKYNHLENGKLVKRDINERDR